MYTKVASLLVAFALTFPVAALAADSTTVVATPHVRTLVTNQAPAGLKEYVASQDSPPLGERLLVWGLLALLIGGSIGASILMTRRGAEADGMSSNAYLRWVRDRSLGHRRE